MAYTDLSGSKLKRQLGATLNESVAAPVASFARRQLEKMGWTEGTGLGRNRDGMATHIKVKKREDEMGLGHEKKKVAEAADTWWSNSVGETLARLSRQNSAMSDKSSSSSKKDSKKSKKSKKKRKKEGSDDDGEGSRKKKRKKSRRETTSGEVKVYTDQELFVATGGARFGMRAQRRAEAKWARTESGSELWEREDEAKRRIEWNGLGGAEVLLDDDGKAKDAAGDEVVPSASVADHGVIEERTRTKSSGRTGEGGTGEKGALVELTPNNSGDDGAGESSSASDGDVDRREPPTDEPESERKKKKKKDKKRKKATDEPDTSPADETSSNSERVGDHASDGEYKAQEESKKEKKKRKKDKKKEREASESSREKKSRKKERRESKDGK